MANEEGFPCAPPEKGVGGRFSYYDQVDIAASKAADTEITKQIIVLQTRIPGDVDVPPYIKVRPENRVELIKRFPDAWKAFEGHDVAPVGTPLTALKIGSDKTLELRLMGVRTMEQLANLSDQQCENLGFGMKTLRQNAKEYLGMEGAKKITPEQMAVPPRVMTQAEIDAAIAEGIAKAL